MPPEDKAMFTSTQNPSTNAAGERESLPRTLHAALMRANANLTQTDPDAAHSLLTDPILLHASTSLTSRK